jgi:hypothetical protein
MLFARFEVRDSALMNFRDPGESADVLPILGYGGTELSCFYRQQLDTLRQRVVALYQPVQPLVGGHNPSSPSSRRVMRRS